MNRENKRKTFEKGYYKTHACRNAFTARSVGGSARRRAPAATTATTAPTA